MCHNSIFKPKYSQASLYLRQLLSITENPKNYILKGLPNMELLTKFFHEILVCREQLFLKKQKQPSRGGLSKRHICWIFSEHLFPGTPRGGCIWKSYEQMPLVSHFEYFWQHYFVLLNMLIVCTSIKMIFLQNVSNFIGQTLTPIPHPPPFSP